MSLDRRSLLALSAAAAASPAMAVKAADPLAGLTVINALGGLGDPNTPDLPKFVVTRRILADAHASGQTAVNCTLGYVFGPRDPFESTVADVAYWDRLVRENSGDLIKIFTVADLARAKASKKVGVIYGFQNCAMMGQDAKRVDLFANMGVRVFQLTYNNANPLGDGSMAPEGRGLSKFGHEVVERINANRCMVDLSHSGTQICLDAARASSRPISINHTGCRALTDLPRNKTDEELRLVAEKGGFIGIYFMPFLNLSGDPAEDYFADGMTDLLTADLSMIPGLKVISRTSAMSFKGTKKPLPEIARALSGHGVIEGSITGLMSRLLASSATRSAAASLSTCSST